MVIIRQFIHTQHDHIGTVLVLRSQFSDNGNAVQNGIAGCLDLFYGGHHSVKVGFDTVGHGTVGLVQMADGHDIADVTQDDTGQLQLVILHIGSTVKAQHVAVDGSATMIRELTIPQLIMNFRFLYRTSKLVTGRM